MDPILPLFFLTGFAGLIYEVVWLRMLVRVFGSTSLATSNVLAVFMGGLALGAWLAGRRSRTLGSPLRAYGAVECALAAAAAAASAALPRLPALVSALGPGGPVGSPQTVAFRSALSACVLLVPTALLGASFPLLVEHSSRRGPGSRTAGGPAALYGVNTLGAVLGVLASGYLLLGRYGESATIAVAVALNAGVGGTALLIGRKGRSRPEPAQDSRPGLEAAASADVIPLFMALSGFCALGLEVLWTRLLVLLLGNSVYAFSSMLAANLLGIGAGSLLCGRRLERREPRVEEFAALQVAAAAAIALAAELYRVQGLSRLDGFYLSSPVRTTGDFYLMLATSALIILPVALVYGMMFPLSIALAEPRGGGKAAGRVYAFNTIGSVLGSLACGLALIPHLGTRNTLYALAAAHIGIAALASEWSGARLRKTLGLSFAALAAAALLRPDPFLEILRARLLKRGPGDINFHLEGASSTVTEFVREGREHVILINGIMVSGKGGLGRIMAHLPLALRESPRRALVICLGAGNTFRAAVDYGVDVDLAELEPEVVAGFPQLWPDARNYLENPRARVHVDDGRNFLLSARGAYDVIIIDGTPPIFSAGTVNLYSREFVELARRRLSKDGVLALWVPLPCFERDFWMIARNFTDSFPHTMAWARPGLTGVLLLGSDGPLDASPRDVARRAARRGLLPANPWLTEALLDPRNVAGDAALRARAAAYPGVTDDRPFTEFPLQALSAGETFLESESFLPFGTPR